MEKESSKSTVLTISMGFLALHLLFGGKWAAIVSLVVGAAGAASPFLARKIEWVWMRLADVLGLVMRNILLTLVFFLFLFPLSLLSRLFTRDPLMLSRDRETYFIDVDREIERESFEKTW